MENWAIESSGRGRIDSLSHRVIESLAEDGHTVRQKGCERVLETGELAGLFSEKGVKKWQFVAKKVGENALFCVQTGEMEVAGDEFWPIADNMSCTAPARKVPSEAIGKMRQMRLLVWNANQSSPRSQITATAKESSCDLHIKLIFSVRVS